MASFSTPSLRPLRQSHCGGCYNFHILDYRMTKNGDKLVIYWKASMTICYGVCVRWNNRTNQWAPTWNTGKHNAYWACVREASRLGVWDSEWHVVGTRTLITLRRICDWYPLIWVSEGDEYSSMNKKRLGEIITEFPELMDCAATIDGENWILVETVDEAGKTWVSPMWRVITDSGPATS